MLEKFISSLLVPYLSKYVENIDEKQLRISLWRGKVTLHDLVLKASVLDEVLAQMDAKHRHRSTVKPLPISIHRGLCRTVNLHIPIFRISSQPIVLEVEEVLLTIRGAMVKHSENGDGSSEDDEDEIPYKSSKWDDAAVQKEKELAKFEKRREEEQRKANLSDQSAEAEEARRAAKKQAGYFTRLAERILNNIIVKVHTVHVRYEDVETNTVLGAVLNGIQLLTIDERTGQPGFTNPNELPCLFKRLEMTGLQLYCDDATRMLACKSTHSCWFTKLEEWQAWYNAMRHRVREGNVGLSTVFGPVSGRVDLHMVFKKYVKQFLTTPYMRIDLILEHMMLRLTRSQYVTIMQAVSKFTNFRGKVRPVAVRPTVPVKGNAKVWWTYILKIVFTVVNEPREQRLLARLSEVFVDEYVSLYRDMVHKKPLTPKQEKAYNFLIRYMTVPAMIQGRLRVYDELAEELRLQREKDEEQEEKNTKEEGAGGGTSPNKKGKKKGKSAVGVIRHYLGWLSWLRGPFASTALPPREELLESLAKDYGVAATMSSGDFGSSTDGPTLPTEVMSGTDPTAPTGLFESPDLPPSYQWLCVVFTQPMLSARVDMSAKESLTLRTQQLQSSFNLFNKANSCQFHICVRNLTLSNPALRPLKGLDMQHLVEGINVNALVRDGGIATSTSVQDRPRIAQSDEAAQFFIKTPPQRSILAPTTSNDSTTAHSTEAAAAAATRNATSNVDGGGGGGAVAKVEAITESPLLDITGAFNPFKQPLPDTQVDVALRVRMLPLRLVLDLISIYNAVKFFELPAEADVSKLTSSTRTAASAVGSAATHELQTALSTAKGFYLSIEVYAPILILPRTLRRSKRETALVASLGRVLLEGHPMSNAEKARRRRMAAGTGEELRYYRHHIAFNNLFLELTTLEDALLHPRTGFMVVPEITLAADLLQLIDEADTTRERLIVRLNIPQLRAALSLHQLYLLLHMVESWVWYMAASRQADRAAKAKLQAEEEARQATELMQTRSAAAFDGAAMHNAQKKASTRVGGGDGAKAEAEERVVAAFQQQHNTGKEGANRSAAASHTSQPNNNNANANANTNRSFVNTNNTTNNVSFVKNGTFAAAAAVVPNSQVHEALVGRPPPDRPLVRLELSVAQLGVHLAEDDEGNNSNNNGERGSGGVHVVRRPQRRPRFALTVADVDFVLATRTMLERMLLRTSSLGLTDTADPARPILSMAAIRIDIARSLVEHTPVEVGIRVRTGTAIRLGTPFLALTEELVDMMHLAQYTVQACTTTLSTGHDPASPTLAQLPELLAAQVRHADDGTESQANNHHDNNDREEDNVMDGSPVDEDYHGSTEGARRRPTKKELMLAYQLQKIAEENAKRDRRESNLTLRLEGTLTLAFLNRGAHDHRDHELAVITVRDLEYFLEKNVVTLAMGANLHEVAVRVAERVGLATAYRAIVHRVSRTHNINTTAATTMREEHASNEDHTEHSPGAASVVPPHVTFTFRSERPVMPVFREVDHGQRVLTNASELHYTNHVEFGLESSVVILDLFTVLLLKTYFSSGFFARVFAVGSRPLYNGKSIMPSQAGPRLLTGLRFVFKDVALVVPAAPRQRQRPYDRLNTLKNDMAYFMLTTTSVVIANRLQLSYGLDELTITPRGIEMGRGVGDMYDFTRRITANPFGLGIAIASPLDQRARQPSKVDIAIRDLRLTLDSNDALVLSAATRRNLMNTNVKDTDTARTAARPIHPVHALQPDSPTHSAASPLTTISAGSKHHTNRENSGGEAFLPAREPPSERSDGSPTTDTKASTTTTTTTNTNVHRATSNTRTQRSAAAAGPLLTIVPPSAPAVNHYSNHNNTTTNASPPSSYSSSSTQTSSDGNERPQIITLNITRVSLDFADAETDASQFRVRLASLVMRRRTPEKAMLLQWRRFDFLDTRDAATIAKDNHTTTTVTGVPSPSITAAVPEPRRPHAHRRMNDDDDDTNNNVNSDAAEGVVMAQCDHGVIRLLTTGMTEAALYAHFGERVPLMSHVEQLAVLQATQSPKKTAATVYTKTDITSATHSDSLSATSTTSTTSTTTTSHSASHSSDKHNEEEGGGGGGQAAGGNGSSRHNPMHDSQPHLILPGSHDSQALVPASGQALGSAFAGAAAQPPIEVTLMTVDLTLRRLAITDQWLGVYDFVLNEKMARAWGTLCDTCGDDDDDDKKGDKNGGRDGKAEAMGRDGRGEPRAAAAGPHTPHTTIAAAAAAADGQGSTSHMREVAKTRRDEAVLLTNTTPTTTSSSSSSSASSTSASSRRSAIRCVINTPRIAIPLLDNRRNTLCEFRAASFLLDLISMDNTTSVALRLGELGVVDARSRYPFVLTRALPTPPAALQVNEGNRAQAAQEMADTQQATNTDTAANVCLDTLQVNEEPRPQSIEADEVTSAMVHTPAQGSMALAPHISRTDEDKESSGESDAAGEAEAARETDAVHIVFETLPAEHRSRIRVHLGLIDVLVSMPIVYGLVDYGTSPVQPIARLTNLGIMHEQRRRLAKTEDNVPRSTATLVELRLHEPRIVLVGDARELARRQHDIIILLGRIHARLESEPRLHTVRVHLSMRDFAIADYSAVTSARLDYEQHHRPLERLALRTQPLVCRLGPAQLERLLWVLRHNLLLPRSVHYYGDLGAGATRPALSAQELAAERAANLAPASPTTRVAAKAEHVAQEEQAAQEQENENNMNTGGVSHSDKHGKKTNNNNKEDDDDAAAAAPVVSLSLGGIWIEIQDWHGRRTHSARISAIEGKLGGSQNTKEREEGGGGGGGGKEELRVVVPLISVVEHFHDRALLVIGTAHDNNTDSSRASRPVSRSPAVVTRTRREFYVGTNAAAAAAVTQCAAMMMSGTLIDVNVSAAMAVSSSSSSSSSSSLQRRMNAIVLTYNVATRHARVKVANITVLVAPRGAGTLINLLLSLRVPPPCEMAACPFAHKDNRPAAQQAQDLPTSSSHTNNEQPGSGMARAGEAAAVCGGRGNVSANPPHGLGEERPTRGSLLFRADSENDSLLEASWSPQLLAHAPVAQRLELIVAGCSLQLAQHDHNIALANVGKVYGAMITYADKGSLMQVTVRSLVVRDSSSAQTRYPVIVHSTNRTNTIDGIALEAQNMPTALTSAAELPSAAQDAYTHNSTNSYEEEEEDDVVGGGYGQGFVEVYLYTEPPLKEMQENAMPNTTHNNKKEEKVEGERAARATTQPALTPRHSKRLRVHVGQLTFVAIPAVLEEMVRAGQALQHYISVGSRTRAQRYVAHCCVATVRHHTEQLTQMNIRVEQPTFVLVEAPMSDQGGITMRPGELIIRSYLVAGGAEPHVVHESAPRLPRRVLYSDSFSLLRRGASYEVIRVVLRQLSATMLTREAFRKKGDVDVMYVRTLPPPYSAPDLYSPHHNHHHHHQRNDHTNAEEVVMMSSNECTPAQEEENVNHASHVTTPLSIALGEGEAANELSLLAAGPTADVLVSISAMKVRLTRAQTDFLLLVAGAFMRGADADEEALQPVKPTTSTGNNNNNNNTNGNENAGHQNLNNSNGNSRSSDERGACEGRVSADHPLAHGSGGGSGEEEEGAEEEERMKTREINSPVYGGPCGAEACRGNNYPGTSPASGKVALRVRCTIDDVLVAELADLFRLTCRGLQMIALYDPSAGSRVLMQLDYLNVQHVGIYVLTRSTNNNTTTTTTTSTTGGNNTQPISSAATSATIRPGTNAATTHVERVNELVDMLKLRHMKLALESSPEQIHEAYLSSVIECHVRCDIARLKLAMSPTSLFDMREVLYLPFVSTVLRIPTDPVCMLNLTEAMTVLERDVVLDNKHVVLTTNRLRCCYALDLNRHRLIFSGDPSGQLVLSEGCELTISNGTIVLPGMYTVDSFVSFGAAATLYTTPDCIIDKRYLDTHRMNTRRKALAAARQAAPPAPLIRARAITAAKRSLNNTNGDVMNALVEAGNGGPALLPEVEPLVSLPGVYGLCPVTSHSNTSDGQENGNEAANAVATSTSATAAAVEAGSHSASECDLSCHNIHHPHLNNNSNNNHGEVMTLTEAARAEEEAAAAARTRRVGTILVERSIRVMGGFACKELILQAYSEEIRDLTSSLHAGVELQFAQDMDNGSASKRSIELQLTQLRSGHREEHIFLPTNLKLSLFGTESVSMTVEMEAVMISTRVALMRSLLEVAKDFQAAFVEELTVKRKAPLAQFEDDKFEPLFSVSAAGRCGRCGRRGAYLAYASDRPGSLCYHCCTGKYSLPAVDFSVDIPLIDCIFLGSRGDFTHLYIRNVHCGVDSGMQVDMSVRACLYNLSNAAAVWEPLIENVEVVLTGSVHAHAYRVRVDRAELVLTPMHLRVLTSMAADFGDATPLQPQLRRRFRLHARRRVREAYNGMRMYVNDLDVAGKPRQLALDIEEEEVDKARAKLAAALREEEHLLLHDEDDGRLRAQEEALLLPPTPLTDMYDAEGRERPCVFDLIDEQQQQQQQQLRRQENGRQEQAQAQAQAQAQVQQQSSYVVEVEGNANTAPQIQQQQQQAPQQAPPPPAAAPQGVGNNNNTNSHDAKTYAEVEVENFCNRVLLVDGHVVGALGGRTHFTTPRRNIVVRRQRPIAGTNHEGYVTSLATPPLYVRGTGMLLRSHVRVRRNAAGRRLERLVQLCALPLHRSNTVLRIHNRLRCAIEVMERHGPRVQPDEYYYLSSVADLNSPLYVRPIEQDTNNSDDASAQFGPATTLSRGVVTLNEVLYGQPLELMCETAPPTTTVDGVTTELAGLPLQTRRRFKLYIVVRQDDMRGGVPIYGIAVQPRYLVENKLPYPVRLHALACTKSSCSREDMVDVCHSTLFASEGMIVRSMSTAPLMIGMACLDEVAFCLQVPQRSTSCHELYVSAPTCFCETRLLTLLANNEREMLIRVVVSNEGILLTTPFAIANHTQLRLTVHECNSAGMIRRPWRSTNYMTLDPCPMRAVPASPHNGEQHRFFVNVYTEGCSALCIPLHVQQRGLIVLEEGGPSESPRTKSKLKLLSVHTSKTALASVAAATAAAVDPARGKMIHLAYLTKTDASGTLLVTITPRWVVVNRTPWPIYVAPSRYAGANAREAAAAAIAEQQSRRAKRAAKEGVALPEDDIYAAADALRHMLEQANDVTDYYLSDPLAAISVGAGLALPFYDTPRMPPEIGYNVHVLLDPHAPLYSTPVHLETIYTEKIIAYVPRKGENDSSTSSDEEEEEDEGKEKGIKNKTNNVEEEKNKKGSVKNKTFAMAQSPPAENALPTDATHTTCCDPDARAAAALAAVDEAALFDLCRDLDPPRRAVTEDEANQPQWDELDVEQIRRDEKAKAAKKEARRARRRNRRQMSAAEIPDTIQRAGRHRYLEVNLTARDSYTFVIVEYPQEVPFIVLNRLDTALVLLDPSRKTAGRVMAHVEPGCGAELLLDVTVTTQMQVVQLTGGAAEQRARLQYEQEQLRQPSADPQRPRVLFDISRPMTARERAQAVLGLEYKLSFGDRGERLIEIVYANPCVCIARTITACPPTPLNVLVNILSTTISVVQPNADLLFAMICDTRLNWKRKERRETWQLSVMHFQVDNQTEVAPRYPACILALRPSDESAAVVAYVERMLTPGKMLLEIKEARLDVKPIAVRVTDTLLLSLMQFAVDVRGGDKIEQQTTHVYRGCIPAGCLYEMAPVQADIMAMHVILENLIINPMLVRFWLTRDENGRDFFKESMPGKMAVVLSIMVSSIDDVQVATPGIVALRREGRLAVILQWLMELYMDSMLAQIRGIVLQYASSLPFIGAPLRLASGIGSGAVRLFAAPIDGLTTSPAAFAQGLASGTVGFAQALVGGGLGAFANLTETGSRVLGKGAGISERQRQRQGFLSGLKHGITGVVERPREAMATTGRAGAMVGAAQGIVGVVANPLSGLLNDLSRRTNQLAGLVSDNYIPPTTRLRPIRVFHANGGVAPANALVAVYHYERLGPEDHVWSGAALIASKDGPEWYPMPANYITYGSHHRPVPATSWILDRFDANFFGWAFSRYYYGCYTYCVTPRARVRRRRWTALVKPLPYSPMAAYLGISPGRELAPRETVQRLLHPQLTFASSAAGPAPQAITRQNTLNVGGNNNNNNGSGSHRRPPPLQLPDTAAGPVLSNPLHSRTGVNGSVISANGEAQATLETAEALLIQQSSSIPFFTQPGVLDACSPGEALQRREQRAQMWQGAVTTNLTSATTPGHVPNAAPQTEPEASVYWSRASAGQNGREVYSATNNEGEEEEAADIHRLESPASSPSSPASEEVSNDGANDVDARLQRGRRQEQELITSATVAAFGIGNNNNTNDNGVGNESYVRERGLPQRALTSFATTAAAPIEAEPLSPTDSRARPPRPLRFDALKMPVDVPARRTRGNRRNPKAEQAHQLQDAAEAKALLERRAQPPPHQLQQQRRQVTPVDVYEYEKLASAEGQPGMNAEGAWGHASVIASNLAVWQDVHGRAVPEPQAIHNPVGWDWLDEWKVVTNSRSGSTDANGWTVMPFDPTLRRRHWQRRLIKRLAMELPSMDAQEL